MSKKRSVAMVVGLGCLGLMLVCTGGFATCGLVAYKGLKSSGPYSDAVSRVRASPEAIAALGKPIDTGWLVSGSIHEGLGKGATGQLSIPVHGPKGSGTLYADGDRTGETWHYRQMELVLKASGKRVDLRTPEDQSAFPDEGAGTAPPSAAEQRAAQAPAKAEGPDAGMQPSGGTPSVPPQ
jgi:hypothetical protein